jgi:hypothetical protein
MVACKILSKICLKNYDMLYDGLGIFAREAATVPAGI